MDWLSIGCKVPDFEAESTFGKIKLSRFLGKWVVLFLYPGDFTPVCTSEVLELAKNCKEFYKRDAQILCGSRDSNSTHLAWLYAMKMTTNIDVPFPVIADVEGKVYKKYVIKNDINAQYIYLISPDGLLCATMTYPNENGFNVDEIIRLLAAAQITEYKSVVTPASWQQNQATMLPAPKTYDELINREENQIM